MSLSRLRQCLRCNRKLNYQMNKYSFTFRELLLRFISAEKDKYPMASLIYRILKNDTNELIYKTEIDSQTENKFMVTKVGS